MIHPPLALRVQADDAARLALFIEFEQNLLGQAESGPLPHLNKKIKDDGRLAVRGIRSWEEGQLSNQFAARGIPTISAPLARAILSRNTLLKASGIDSAAPLGLWNKNGTPSDLLATVCRKIVDDKGLHVKRVERLALARLCLVSLIRIERFIFDAAAGIQALQKSDNTTIEGFKPSKEQPAVKAKPTGLSSPPQKGVKGPQPLTK